jgi:hypothetical protein
VQWDHSRNLNELLASAKQVLNGSESPMSSAKWGPPAPQLSSAPIRSRACVSRSASSAAAQAALSIPAADAKSSPSRDSTPRKADRPEIVKFFSGWVSPVLSTFR